MDARNRIDDMHGRHTHTRYIRMHMARKYGTHGNGWHSTPWFSFGIQTAATSPLNTMVRRNVTSVRLYLNGMVVWPVGLAD